jgi:hypothetical protein
MTPPARRWRAGRCRSASVGTAMTSDPDRIRHQIAALLADLPDPAAGDVGDVGDVDIDALGARLEEAHDMLVRALESVEKR